LADLRRHLSRLLFRVAEGGACCYCTCIERRLIARSSRWTPESCRFEVERVRRYGVRCNPRKNVAAGSRRPEETSRPDELSGRLLDSRHPVRRRCSRVPHCRHVQVLRPRRGRCMHQGLLGLPLHRSYRRGPTGVARSVVRACGRFDLGAGGQVRGWGVG
jgi:hypothetical protein